MSKPFHRALTSTLANVFPLLLPANSHQVGSIHVAASSAYSQAAEQNFLIIVLSDPVNPDCILGSPGELLDFRCPDFTPDQLNHNLQGEARIMVCS